MLANPPYPPCRVTFSSFVLIQAFKVSIFPIPSSKAKGGGLKRVPFGKFNIMNRFLGTRIAKSPRPSPPAGEQEGG